MSTLVLTNDSLVFGPHSPLYRVQTEAGLKEAFMRLLLDKSSQVMRKRSFATYMLASKIFPKSEIQISDHIKHGIGQLLDPFIGYSVKGSIDSVMNVKRNQYFQGEVAFTNELAKGTKIKNVIVMVSDSAKDTYAEQKGITTYLTRSFQSTEDNIEATWANSFFTFNDTASLNLVVIVPKSYIANLMINIQASNSHEINGIDSMNRLAFRSILIDAFAVDLVKSFFVSVYSDGFKARVNHDIAALNTLFQKEGENIFTGAYLDNCQDAVTDALKKYTDILKGFKTNDCENLIYEMLKFIQYRNSAIVNTLDFYTAIIDIPYAQMSDMFKKIAALNVITQNNPSLNCFNFGNSLSDMNRFFVDSERDVVVYGLKLIRYLPFLIFNTYVIGGGTDHTRLQTVLSNARSIITSINSFRSKSPIYAPTCSFIVSELEYMLDTFAKQMGSPMSVNEKSRTAIAGSIIKINRLNTAMMVPDSGIAGNDAVPEYVATSDIEKELNHIAEKGTDEI